MRNFIGACEVFEGVFGCRVFVHLQSGAASPDVIFKGGLMERRTVAAMNRQHFYSNYEKGILGSFCFDSGVRGERGGVV
jgi:hypothetical protein